MLVCRAQGQRVFPTTLQEIRAACCTEGLHCVLQAAGASCCGAAGEAAVGDGEGAAGAVAVAALVSQPPVLS